MYIVTSKPFVRQANNIFTLYAIWKHVAHMQSVSFELRTAVIFCYLFPNVYLLKNVLVCVEECACVCCTGKCYHGYHVLISQVAKLADMLFHRFQHTCTPCSKRDTTYAVDSHYTWPFIIIISTFIVMAIWSWSCADLIRLHSIGEKS